MPGLDPGIHVFLHVINKTWMAGSSPAMTKESLSIYANPHVNPRLPALTRQHAATM